MTIFTKVLGLSLVGIFLAVNIPADAKLAANKLAANELAANAMSVGNGAFNDVVVVELANGTRLAR